MRIALVHYWLVGLRGGEKVLEAICEIYPDADIYTHIYDRDAVGPVIGAHKITTTFISKLPFARRLYRSYLPLMPFALEALDLSEYDLVISSESGPAKGVLTRPNAIHVCYCHSPMRYLWDQYQLYRSSAGPVARLMMPLLSPFLRIWDVLSANRVDHFIANSRFVAKRIQKTYRREAEVVFPPVKLEEYDIEAHPTLDYYFFISQLEAYKRADIVIEAANQLGRRLIIVGGGSEEERLRKLAGPSVTFLGRQSTEEIAKLYKNSWALLFAGTEDFGIIFLEAMASGRPVIAYAAGGALDAVVDGKTGLFFQEQTAESLSGAILKFEENPEIFDSHMIRAHAETFGTEVFKKNFKAVIDRACADMTAKSEPPRPD
jgi:glycosyltransferase involved in cell wall biosynthesis